MVIIFGDKIKTIKKWGETGRLEKVVKLRQLLNNKDTKVQAAVCEALGHMHSMESNNLLVPMLRNRNEDVRKAAAISLQSVGKQNAIESLRHTLAAEKNPEVAAEMRKAIIVLTEGT